MRKDKDVIERAHRIACAVSDAIWGGELGWVEGDVDALIRTLRQRLRKTEGVIHITEEAP